MSSLSDDEDETISTSHKNPERDTNKVEYLNEFTANLLTMTIQTNDRDNFIFIKPIIFDYLINDTRFFTM
jgi:hypothetical protein